MFKNLKQTSLEIETLNNEINQEKGYIDYIKKYNSDNINQMQNHKQEMEYLNDQIKNIKL